MKWKEEKQTGQPGVCLSRGAPNWKLLWTVAGLTRQRLSREIDRFLLQANTKLCQYTLTNLVA